MHLRQVSVRHVSIDLRGIDAGMTQELLHGADVSAIIQQISSEGVAHNVWRHLFGDTCLGGICLSKQLYGARSETGRCFFYIPTSGHVYEQRVRKVFASF